MMATASGEKSDLHSSSYLGRQHKRKNKREIKVNSHQYLKNDTGLELIRTGYFISDPTKKQYY